MRLWPRRWITESLFSITPGKPHDGLSEERLGKALKGKRQQAFVMTKVCTHGRDKKVAMRMLEESLRRLQTDHLDLWQIHEVVYDNDPILSLPQMAQRKRCWTRSSTAKFALSVLPDTRIRRSI